MAQLIAVIQFLDGRKTYLAAAGYLAFAAVQFFYLADPAGATSSVLAAATLVGARSAVQKVIDALTPKPLTAYATPLRAYNPPKA